MKALSVILPAWILSTSLNPAAAQDQIWIRQDGTSTTDTVQAAAPDGSGGVHASGWTAGDLGGPQQGAGDAWLARYDAAGNELWLRQFGTSAAEEADAAAADGSGGVYVSGSTNGSLGGPNAGDSDVWLARHDDAGNQLWIRQFGTSASDRVFAAASDGAGGVFATGFTYGNLGGPSAGGGDIWLARYDGAGNQLWIRQFGTSGGDFAGGAAADGSGGLYVSGRTRGNLDGPNQGASDACLARYDSAGNQLWIRQLGTSGLDEAYTAASDGSGGVYISGLTTGSLDGPIAGGLDSWLARYDGAGTQLWVRQFGTSANEIAHAAAPDGLAGVYLCGFTFGELGGINAGSSDAWLARFDSSGDELWIQQLGSDQGDGANVAASDASGDLFVGGSTQGDLGGPNAGQQDFWLARYDRGDVIAFCFGDGSGAPCPCGNRGAAGEGCANSSTAGALVSSTGSTSVSADDLAFVAANLLPAQPALLFAGVNAINGGAGDAFGDGLRCAGGNVVRLGIELPDAQGDATYGPGIASLGGFAPGDLRRFQVWYRDPVGGPCASGFNLSHGLEVVFTP